MSQAKPVRWGAVAAATGLVLVSATAHQGFTLLSLLLLWRLTRGRNRGFSPDPIE